MHDHRRHETGVEIRLRHQAGSRQRRVDLLELEPRRGPTLENLAGHSFAGSEPKIGRSVDQGPVAIAVCQVPKVGRPESAVRRHPGAHQVDGVDRQVQDSEATECHSNQGHAEGDPGEAEYAGRLVAPDPADEPCHRAGDRRRQYEHHHDGYEMACEGKGYEHGSEGDLQYRHQPSQPRENRGQLEQGSGQRQEGRHVEQAKAMIKRSTNVTSGIKSCCASPSMVAEKARKPAKNSE